MLIRAWNRESKKMYAVPLDFPWDVANFGLIALDMNPAQIDWMLSTGLKDKKGLEAFKDDIIRTGNGRIWVIKQGTYFWHVPGDIIELCGFYLEPVPNLDNHPIPIYEGFGEVIGNCHQHPELSETKA